MAIKMCECCGKCVIKTNGDWCDRCGERLDAHLSGGADEYPTTPVIVAWDYQQEIAGYACDNGLCNCT